MKLGMMLSVRKDVQWQLARQTGVTLAVTKAAPELSGLADPSDFESLKQIRDCFKENGLELYALEGDEFDMSRIKLGLPGRDEDLEKYCRMLTNMGRLGIRLLCYNFMAGIGWFRTKTDLQERGGALTSGFCIDDIDNQVPVKITEEELWDNYRYFINAVMPAAEAAGVKMGLHPDDPPVSPLLGYSRIFTSADAYRKAMRISDSPSHGITFCQASFRCMGENVMELMREFNERIFFLHIRDVRGNRNNFQETFHDNGPTDMAELMRAASKYAGKCLIRPDHTPTMTGDSNEKFGYTVQGNIFAVGYIKGILDSINYSSKNGDNDEK